jgi:hypothetical protein
MSENMKTCTKCKISKSLDDFYNSFSRGLDSVCKCCQREIKIKRYYENPKKYNKLCHDYYLKNKEKLKEYRKNYYEENIDHCRLVGRLKYNRDKEKLLKQQSDRIKKIRDEVIKEYGGVCECCGESNNEFLQIDHIDGNGYKHRKSIPGKNVLLWLKRNNYPKDGFRLLCANCNWSIGIWGYCPHETLKVVSNG